MGHDHDHGVSADSDRRWLWVALALIVALMGGEVVVGLLSGSLALLSDAAHMLTDAAAIGLALLAMDLAARPARGSYTYGLKRAEILSAMANGTTLVVLSVWLLVEAVRRLVHPPSVSGVAVLVTALVGVAVNLAATWALSRADRRSLNVEGAFQHVLTDLFAFLATVIAGVVMVTTGWKRADAVATLVVVALMVRAGVRLVRASVRVFMEAAPVGTDPIVVRELVLALDGVVAVRDLHIWQISSVQVALSAHVYVDAAADCHDVRRSAETLLHDTHGIGHTTLQVDHLEPDARPDALESEACVDSPFAGP
ncbi:cation diffusion facilitator family transporter [Nocardioides montaniterrae]